MNPLPRTASRPSIRAAALAAAFFAPGLVAGPVSAQDPPTEERCTCARGEWGEAGEALAEALARAREAMERSREAAERSREVSMEQLEGLQERVRAHMDTLRIAWPSRTPRARLGLELSTDPVEGLPGGVRIAAVEPRSGADEAGLRVGDVVVSVNDHDLGRPLAEERLRSESPAPLQRLQALAAEVQPGDTVRVGFVREGENRTANVEARRWPGFVIAGRGPLPVPAPRSPEARPVDPEGVLLWPAFPGGSGRSTARIGQDRIEVVDLNPDLARYFGTEEGALVLESPIEGGLDLQGGDVITGIDGRPVRSAGDARRILSSYRSGETISVEVRREGRTVRLGGEVRE